MMVDCNVSLGRWPFQAFAVRTPGRLARHLAAEGVSGAWVSAVESILYPDPDVYDAALFRAMQPHRTLRFVKTINPTLPNCRASLAAWSKQRRVCAVKVFPTYHQYSAADDCAVELAEAVCAARLPLLVQMRVEDERSHYPLMRVPGVPFGEVIALAGAVPTLPVVALCPYFAEAKELAAGPPNLHVDLSFIETPDTVRTVLGFLPARRVLFGSHTPFMTTRSEVMKLEFARVGARDRDLISRGNAARLLKGRRRSR